MKKNMLFLILMIISISLSAQSIKDLDFLIGQWEVSEVAFPGTDREYIEKGTRECKYYLNDAYIKCESSSTRKGRPRKYTFLFNYVGGDIGFRLIKLSSDFPSYAVKSWKIQEDMNLIFEEDLRSNQFISDISFEDKDKIVWRGWSPKNGKNPKLQLIFREEAVRKQ